MTYKKPKDRNKLILNNLKDKQVKLCTKAGSELKTRTVQEFFWHL